MHHTYGCTVTARIYCSPSGYAGPDPLTSGEHVCGRSSLIIQFTADSAEIADEAIAERRLSAARRVSKSLGCLQFEVVSAALLRAGALRVAGTLGEQGAPWTSTPSANGRPTRLHRPRGIWPRPRGLRVPGRLATGSDADTERVGAAEPQARIGRRQPRPSDWRTGAAKTTPSRRSRRGLARADAAQRRRGQPIVGQQLRPGAVDQRRGARGLNVEPKVDHVERHLQAGVQDASAARRTTASTGTPSRTAMTWAMFERRPFPRARRRSVHRDVDRTGSCCR